MATKIRLMYELRNNRLIFSLHPQDKDQYASGVKDMGMEGTTTNGDGTFAGDMLDTLIAELKSDQNPRLQLFAQGLTGKFDEEFEITLLP